MKKPNPYGTIYRIYTLRLISGNITLREPTHRNQKCTCTMGCCVIPMSGVFINGPLQRTHIFIQICLVFFTNSAWARSMGVIKTSVFYFISRLVFHLRCDWPHMHAPLWEFTVKWGYVACICNASRGSAVHMGRRCGRSRDQPRTLAHIQFMWVPNAGLMDWINYIWREPCVCVCICGWFSINCVAQAAGRATKN